MPFPSTLIGRFRVFVNWLKMDDKEAGEDLLRRFESSTFRETRQFGFMLSETAMILYQIVEHQKRLDKISHQLTDLTTKTV